MEATQVSTQIQNQPYKITFIQLINLLFNFSQPTIPSFFKQGLFIVLWSDDTKKLGAKWFQQTSHHKPTIDTGGQ